MIFGFKVAGFPVTDTKVVENFTHESAACLSNMDEKQFIEAEKFAPLTT